MTREERIRETLEKVMKINEGSSKHTPFAHLEVTGGYVDSMNVTVFPDGWHGIGDTTADTYLVYFDAFDENEYMRIQAELDKLIEEKEKRRKHVRSTD